MLNLLQEAVSWYSDHERHKVYKKLFMINIDCVNTYSKELTGMSGAAQLPLVLLLLQRLQDRLPPGAHCPSVGLILDLKLCDLHHILNVPSPVWRALYIITFPFLLGGFLLLCLFVRVVVVVLELTL